MVDLEALMGKLVESQIETNQNMKSMADKLDALIEQGMGPGDPNAVAAKGASELKEPEKVIVKYRIMYTMSSPLYPDKNNSADDVAFISDSKGTRNFNTKEEAEEYIATHPELIKPIIREIRL